VCPTAAVAALGMCSFVKYANVCKISWWVSGGA